MSSTHDAAQRRIVSLAPWAAWAAMTVALTLFVFSHASRFPFNDDVGVLALKRYDLPLNWAWLWSAHNDHRLPIVRLCMLGMLEIGAGDFRAPLVLHVVALSLVSAALIVAARVLRGRASAADAFFPLLWMSCGNAENLLWAHQIQMTLTSTLVVVVALLLGRPGSTRTRLVLAALGTFALPLCGGGGVAQAPILAGLLVWAGLERRREDRVATWIAALGAAGVVALSVWYFVDLEPSSIYARPSSGSEVAWAGVGVASLAFGALPLEGWEIVGAAVIALGVVATTRMLRGLRADPVQRTLAFVLIAQFALIAAIVSSRSDPVYHMRATRYVSLLFPLASAAYLSWTRAPGRFQPLEFALCASAAAALFGTWGGAVSFARERAVNDALLLEELRGGATSAELARASNGHFFRDTDFYAKTLATMRRLRMGPFREATWSEDVENEVGGVFESLVTQPIAAYPRRTIRERQLIGRRVLCSPPPTKLVYAGPKQPTRLLGECGLLLAVAPDERKQLRSERMDGGPDLVLVVEVLRSNGWREVLLRRELRIADKPAQRRVELDLAVPAYCARIELRYETTGGELPDGALPYWHGIELRP